MLLLLFILRDLLIYKALNGTWEDVLEIYLLGDLLADIGLVCVPARGHSLNDHAYLLFL